MATMMRPEMATRIDGLEAARASFATATVVRRQRPSSVHPGDAAIVLADGTIEGFVGGACAEESVRLHTARVLETGEPLLLRIVAGDGDGPVEEGAVTVSNPCLSGGALEIFLEPHVPAPRIAIVGETPTARALERLARETGFAAASYVDQPLDAHDDDAAVVIASHGHGEEEALERALATAVPYIGLVASRRRGAAVRESLSADASRVRSPAGLDIGARTPEHVALAILAEIVSVRAELHPPAPSESVAAPAVHEHHCHHHDH
jgi:xanthine dehydrogenase accessory factor